VAPDVDHTAMRRSERDRFDALLEQVIDELPQRIRDLMEEAPVIVDDRPSKQLAEELGLDPNEENLCGLHSGTALTERSVAHGHDLPETIHIFREGVLEEAGGWEPWQDEDGQTWGGEDAVKQEIRITLLHEIGHHFGLDENDLAKLGYD
jgi:predicted Zn-dependent protease with MMP-like domain